MIPRAAVFLMAAATLLLEIVLTRIFSVVFWYHFAFVSISVAMAGIAVSGLLLHGWRTRLLAHPEKSFALCGLCFEVSTVGSLAAALSAGHAGATPGLLSTTLVCTLCSLPFLSGGLAVAVALAAGREVSGATYAADLAGAAAGAASAPLVLSWMDGPAAGLLAGLLAALGAWLCLMDRTRLGALLAGAALLSLQLTLHPLHLSCPKGDCTPPEAERWNHFSRVAVSPEFSGRPVGLSWSWEGGMRLREMAIDAAASTPIISATTPPGWTGSMLTALPYQVRPGVRSVFVSGAGGGPDVLIARGMGAEEVTAAEINPSVVAMSDRVFSAFSGRPLSAPGVRLRVDDARSVLEREPDRYDLVVMSLVDTLTAASAGAFALTESNLYTREAFSLDLKHLTHQGLFSVSRWYYPGRSTELARLAALARSALESEGGEPAGERMLMAAWQNRATGGGVRWGVGLLIASPTPFDQAERDRFGEACRRLGFSVLWPVTDPTAGEPLVTSLLEAPDLRAWLVHQQDVLDPPTDDWPFFFQASRLLRASSGDYLGGGLQVLMTLLTGAAAFALGLLALGRRLTAPSHGLAAATAAFALGVGFMLVEIGLLQRLLLLLGHPTYTLALVLPVILVAAALGSARSRLQASTACLLVAVVVASAAVLLPGAIEGLLPFSRPAKVAFALPLLVAIGLPMGMPFPALLRREGGSTAWLWAINGAAGVLGSVLAMVIAVVEGYAAVFLAAACAYLIAALALRRGAIRAGAASSP